MYQRFLLVADLSTLALFSLAGKRVRHTKGTEAWDK